MILFFFSQLSKTTNTRTYEQIVKLETFCNIMFLFFILDLEI